MYEKPEDIYVKLVLKAARRTASCQPLTIVKCSGAEFFILEQTDKQKTEIGGRGKAARPGKRRLVLENIPKPVSLE